jgi:uncharacterized small protein (DUF1192 family)
MVMVWISLGIYRYDADTCPTGKVYASKVRRQTMDWDDAKPKPVRVAIVSEKLDEFSVTDLEQRVRELEAEITRVKATLSGKKSHSAAADALFKR